MLIILRRLIILRGGAIQRGDGPNEAESSRLRIDCIASRALHKLLTTATSFVSSNVLHSEQFL